MTDIELTKLRSGNSRLQQHVADLTRQCDRFKKETKKLRKEIKVLEAEMARQKKLLKPRGK